MIGKTVSHYRITEQIGSGGMGVVYKAEDTKLKRTVALKFLPSELIRDPEAKARFIREAQAASGLQHHNICNIHDIDETPEGQLFIVMDCYEGRTLKEMLVGAHHDAPDRHISMEQAISITIQIAEGLGKAHAKSIVHRDIKPANIFITNDGQVKILDFGVAKLAGKAHLTKDSSTLGTVAYMSPEQLSGKEVDQRTDIWSLGVILYEMLTGDLPFPGDYEQAIMYAILNEEPKSMESIPSELQNALRKALFKNPDERYASVAELLNELTAIRETHGFSKLVRPSPKSTRKKVIIISAVAMLIVIAAIIGVLFYPTSEPEASLKSLAVLPFTNIGNDATTDYLGFSLANQIIGDLTYLKNITVRPSTSIEKYKDQSVDPIEAARELHAEFLLTGRYLKETDKIRSDIELINVATNNLIWREPIEVNFENAFQLQDIVSEKVINGLKIQFSQEERIRMRSDIPKNPLAYEYYLKSFAYPNTVEGSRMAIKTLNQSIKIDSSYAPAFYELGYHTTRFSQFLLGYSEEHKKTEKYLLKAISLNRDYIDARTLLGGFYTETGNTDKALKITKEALKINPNNAWTHFRLSYIYRYTGLNEESIRAVKKALELLPNNPRFRSARQNFLYVGDFKKALELADLDKTNPISFAFKGLVLLRMGDSLKADNNFKLSIELEPDSASFAFNFANACMAYLNNHSLKAKEYLNRIETGNPYDGELLYEIASIYGLINDKKNCIHVLEKAVKGGFYNYPFFLIDPFLDQVRDDLEFQEVLALTKQKHEAFKQKYFAEME
jgi:serine/threonine protein kinase/Tfp pilus assembly protein PilF